MRNRWVLEGSTKRWKSGLLGWASEPHAPFITQFEKNNVFRPAQMPSDYFRDPTLQDSRGKPSRCGPWATGSIGNFAKSLLGVSPQMELNWEICRFCYWRCEPFHFIICAEWEMDYLFGFSEMRALVVEISPTNGFEFHQLYLLASFLVSGQASFKHSNFR